MKQKILGLINQSPTCYNVVENVKKELIKKNFHEIKENEKFSLKRGESYFVIRNDSCLAAFSIGKKLDEDYKFKIIASHTDSPAFKIKPVFENKTDIYHKVNIEPYGGMINSTWLDRPLSIAGRLIIKNKNKIETKIINIDKPTLIIPNMCIHFNRQINNGYAYNYATDLQPLIGQGEVYNNLMDLLSSEANVNKQDILNFDLFVYNNEKGYLWGKNNEYITSPRLDDLEGAFISIESLLNSADEKNINVCVLFDNEEVGSTTIQGANSDFLDTILRRINISLGYQEEVFYQAISKSFLISCDNAHSVHPNFPNQTDADNKVYMNKGIVIKFNASQSYTSNGLSSAFMQNLCEASKVPYQYFTNRSDIRGGSTLGNISNTHVSILSIDIGLAQLAMHSSLETAGSEDINFLYKVLQEFYNN